MTQNIILPPKKVLANCDSSLHRVGTPKHTQTLIDATQKETAIDQQQHSCETLICQRHQTILRLFSSAATASTRWRVGELYSLTTYSAMCVLTISTTFFSGTFFILRTEQDMIISVHTYSCKVPVIIVSEN